MPGTKSDRQSSYLPLHGKSYIINLRNHLLPFHTAKQVLARTRFVSTYESIRLRSFHNIVMWEFSTVKKKKWKCWETLYMQCLDINDTLKTGVQLCVCVLGGAAQHPSVIIVENVVRYLDTLGTYRREMSNVTTRNTAWTRFKCN